MHDVGQDIVSNQIPWVICTGSGFGAGTPVLTRTRPERYPYPQPMRVTLTRAHPIRTLVLAQSGFIT